jgi:hypothetical protein
MTLKQESNKESVTWAGRLVAIIVLGFALVALTSPAHAQQFQRAASGGQVTAGPMNQTNQAQRGAQAQAQSQREMSKGPWWKYWGSGATQSGTGNASGGR